MRSKLNAITLLVASAFFADQSPASPVQVSALQRAQESEATDMVPSKDTMLVKDGYAPFIMQLLFVDGPHPVSAQAAGLRCTGFIVAHGETLSLLTAAHCLAINGFSLRPEGKKLPQAIVLSDGKRKLDVALPPHAVTFDPTLVRRFATGPGEFSWDLLKTRNDNIAALFFPGEVAGCQNWPVDVARIDLPLAKLAAKWPGNVFPAAKKFALAATRQQQRLRVLGGGCTVADPVACATNSAVYRRYDDPTFSVTQQLDCGRVIARSSSSTEVMPGDSGGPIFASGAAGNALDQLVGVVSGQWDKGSLIIAPVPSTIYGSVSP